MAVASLRYRPNATPAEESKGGFVVFSGEAQEFHYWFFRTKLKLECIPPMPGMEDLSVTESETGDASFEQVEDEVLPDEVEVEGPGRRTPWRDRGEEG